MAESTTILKHPDLPESSNYEWLRKKGLEYIEQLGSAIWTDYNIHDPGITILELLCYAITDLGYRTSFDIKDLLASPTLQEPKDDPARQGFFTAREILTVNPWTTADFRKLLVDIDGIKNAWLTCKECPCEDLYLYANCAKSILQYAENEHPITIKGLYDVLVEFDNEPGIGDLNSGKVTHNFIYTAGVDVNPGMIEIRLPSWQHLIDKKEVYKDLFSHAFVLQSVEVKFISGNKNDNVNIPDNALPNVLRRPVYATIEIVYQPDANLPETATLLFEDIPMKVWLSNDGDRRVIQLADIFQAMEDASPSGIFGKYLQLIQRADEVMQLTNSTLQQHRNLAEDYCSIRAVPVEDIGVCADLEVSPEADIEAILAEAYYRIDQYLSPDIKFYSLKELMDTGIPVEEIFKGPQLDNGFIDNDQLDASNLKQFIYTSDIINLLMDIPGVKAISNFVLTKYNTEGNLVENEPWMLKVSDNHQPRLYIQASKVLVFKNGLPFLPDLLELNDTLQVIKGQRAQPQYNVGENDLTVPAGKYYDLQSYFPVQHMLPLTYGVSTYGLPATASEERKAQAKQLKAYLLFFEQMLINYLSQLTHVKELFAIDQKVGQTYFSKVLGTAEISDIEDFYNGLNSGSLQSLLEDENTFHDRRNRFLNHLLARFAENFNEYTLMLHAYSDSKKFADEKLIRDKVNFLKDLPFMSANRAKAINYKLENGICSSDNVSGLEVRIKRLLGLENSFGYFELYEENDIDGKFFERRWRLKDGEGKLQLSGSTRYFDEVLSESERKAKVEIQEVKKYISDPARFDVKKVKKWVVNLTDPTGEIIATRKHAFNTKAEAEKVRDEILEFGRKLVGSDKIYVVEHLLFRPGNVPGTPGIPNGDPMLSVCIPNDCAMCGEEDPYSFRVTIVMSGETGIANSGIEFRRFAEATIRREVPAHLGVKICWVSNEQLVIFETAWCAWLAELAKPEPDRILQHQKLVELLQIFEELKSVYPEARLHDCRDGNDSNRVFLGNTII